MVDTPDGTLASTNVRAPDPPMNVNSPGAVPALRYTWYSVPLEPVGLSHRQLSFSEPLGSSSTLSWYGVPGTPRGAGVAGAGIDASVYTLGLLVVSALARTCLMMPAAAMSAAVTAFFSASVAFLLAS